MLPPSRTSRPDYGFIYQMLANCCLVTHVRPHSDAELKSITPGDEVLLINGDPPSRETLWKTHYKYEILRPQQFLHLRLRDLHGQDREIDVASRLHQVSIVTPSDLWDPMREEESDEHRMLCDMGFSNDLLAVKFPVFRFSPINWREISFTLKILRVWQPQEANH